MQLCEEYLKRNNIPVFYYRHTENGVLYLRNKDKMCVMTLRYDHSDRGPGRYLLNINFVPGDRYDDAEQVQFEWNEFEDKLKNYFKKYKHYVPMLTESEVYVFAWEQYVKKDPKSLNQYAVSDLFFSTIDYDLSVKERHDSIIKFTSGNNEFVRWNKEFSAQIKNYLWWINDLTALKNN